MDISDEQAKILLRVARMTIQAALNDERDEAGRDDIIVNEPWLALPGACFVTLKKFGQLRGCIGSLEAHRPLIDDVRRNAYAAAFKDPRFPVMATSEWDQVKIELSLLSSPEPIPFSTEAEALSVLQVGVDGVIFEYGVHQSTFLPQVWAQLPDPALFMAHLKRKAGLAEDFWSGDVRLSRYQVQSLSEPEPEPE